MSERGSGSRGCGTVALVVLPAVAGVAVWGYLSLRPEPQPGVEKVARSAAARAAGGVVSARLDGQLGQLGAALPWATRLGATVADVCETDTVDHGFAITRDTWLPVTCTRTVTVYSAFDGDFKERLRQVDTALSAAGWRAGEVPNRAGTEGGLVEALAYAHSPGGGASAEETAVAAARPNVAWMQYTLPLKDDFVVPAEARGNGGRPTATVQMAQAPHLPYLDDGTALHDVALKYPTVRTRYYVDWQQYGRDRLAADAYPAHGAVLVVSVRAGYNAEPAGP
ncbi:hypothetical protein GCM10020229_34880 [Kitasatospora albolonga]|uniref:hypothetical protein n=1 Tax=Kitasatospora albolonga TaxID=68173 RepID=UPI00337C762C